MNFDLVDVAFAFVFGVLVTVASFTTWLGSELKRRGYAN